KRGAAGQAKSARVSVASEIAGRTRAKRTSARIEQPSGLFDPMLCARAGRALLGRAEAGHFDLAARSGAAKGRGVERSGDRQTDGANCFWMARPAMWIMISSVPAPMR